MKPLQDQAFDPNALALFSGVVAKHFVALPIALGEDASVRIAVSDPSCAEELRAVTNRAVATVVYPPEEILSAIEGIYRIRPPSPEPTSRSEAPSVERDPILDRFAEALRRRPSLSPDPYALADDEADVATLVVDEVLAQGSSAQTRLYWGIDGIFEEQGERFVRTDTPPEAHFDRFLRRLRMVAGLPEASRGPAHCRFELEAGEWRFIVYAAFLDDGALLEFYPGSRE